MFKPFVRILNRLAAIFLGSSTGKYERQTTTFFLLLAGGFVFLSFGTIAALGMRAPDPTTVSDFDIRYLLIPIFLAVGCFWLAVPVAWSNAFYLYIPRAIILVAVGVSLTVVGVALIGSSIDFALSGQGGFGDMLFVMILAPFDLAIASVCFWAAVPPSWKKPGASREEAP